MLLTFQFRLVSFSARSHTRSTMPCSAISSALAGSHSSAAAPGRAVGGASASCAGASAAAAAGAGSGSGAGSGRLLGTEVVANPRAGFGLSAAFFFLAMRVDRG
jgi:hypothetical protein